MATECSGQEAKLRRRCRALGYDLYKNDGRYVLAKRLAGYRRQAVVGNEGGATSEEIERWLDEHHPHTASQ
jgi:hypothetical protein